jgi:hypothetical protein
MTDAATPETATASESLDLHGAARAIERILRSEGERGGPSRRRRPNDPSAGDEPPAATAGEEPEDDVSSEDYETETPAGDQPRYSIKIDGEEHEVPLQELLKGYQRNADYTRKTMRLSDEKRALEADRQRHHEEGAAVAAERQRYASAVDSVVPRLRHQLQAGFGTIDWVRLANEDPARFAQLRPMHDSLWQQLQQAEAAQMTLRQSQLKWEAVRQEQTVRYAEEQRQLLKKNVPEMSDDDSLNKEIATLKSYLEKVGYRPEEIATLQDHRDTIIARKAMLYDRLMGGKGKAERLAALPRVQRPGTASARIDRARESRAVLMQRLKRTGRTEDAARLIEDML